MKVLMLWENWLKIIFDTNAKPTRTGDFHPISWYHNHDGGRSFYTALGHIPALYEDDLFLEHIYGGIYWAATGNGIKKEIGEWQIVENLY